MRKNVAKGKNLMEFNSKKKTLVTSLVTVSHLTHLLAHLFHTFFFLFISSAVLCKLLASCKLTVYSLLLLEKKHSKTQINLIFNLKICSYVSFKIFREQIFFFSFFFFGMICRIFPLRFSFIYNNLFM